MDDRLQSELTAYALGELEGADKLRIAALLLRDAAARAYVEEVRRSAGDLAQALQREPALELSAEQRAAIASAAPRPALRRRSVWWSGIGVAAAASVAVAGLGYWIARQTRATRKPKVELGVPYTYSLLGDAGAPSSPAAAAPHGHAAGYAGSSVQNQTLVARAEVKREQSLQSIGYADQRSEGRGAFNVSNLGGQAPDGSTPSAGYFYKDGENDPQLQTKDSDISEQLGNTESYSAIVENAFCLARNEPLSTFSIDVDTASYSNVRRMLLREQRLPDPGAVRIEELLNYFRYDYPAPQGEVPFSATTEVAIAPWAPAHKLVRIGLRGKDISVEKRQPVNLVFLLDVSGSMQSEDKLPLVQRSMRLLVDQLDERDRVAIVIYAGSEGLALPSTSCAAKGRILAAIDELAAGGSTHGAAGIRLAYEIAAHNYAKEGINRVVLCTDGDFNVGTTSEAELVDLIEQKRKGGVFLSVLGFGTGNLKDSTMEQLADKGNGNYAYVDSLAEARKVLVAEMGGTLFPIAKDVKIQVEFNPLEVQAWRLIGYENRLLAAQDFNDDTKDAGEIGAGVCVTALYEIVPAGVPFDAPKTDELRYQQPSTPTANAQSGELLHLKLRYKQPAADTSQLIDFTVPDATGSIYEASGDFRFAAAVAGFGMRLRNSAHVHGWPLEQIRRLAVDGIGEDRDGYRRELIELIRAAEALEPVRER